MKMKPRQLIEVDEEGLEALIGEQVTFYCINYIYTGTLVGVNDTCIKLENPAIVYETGPHNDKNWKDAQKLPNDLYITRCSIESFSIMKLLV
jgi:hypothetical protein